MSDDDIDDDQEWEIRPLGIIFLSTHSHPLTKEIGERLAAFMRRNNLIIEAKDDGLYFGQAETIKVEVAAKPRL